MRRVLLLLFDQDHRFTYLITNQLGLLSACRSPAKP